MQKSKLKPYSTKLLNLCTIVLVLSFVSACANRTDGGEAAGRGAKWGAVGGAAVGLALGAVTGDKQLMAVGAATGAIAGGASGAMYEYGQHRDDKRNQALADAIDGSKTNSSAGQSMANPLESFIGEWQVNAWGLMPDGKKVTGTGAGKGVLTAKSTARVDCFNIQADGYQQALSGYAIINFTEKDGLSMSTYGADDAVDARFVGEYIAEQKKFNFYLTDSQSANTVTGYFKGRS